MPGRRREDAPQESCCTDGLRDASFATGGGIAAACPSGRPASRGPETAMTEDRGAETVLKILTGVQSGVDVVLTPGEYTLGSGDDDDIQIFDVSLEPGHARLSIARGKVEIAGLAGGLNTRNGLVIEAGGIARPVEPLDVVSAGSSQFAIGPRTANWSSIVDAPQMRANAPERDGGERRPAARWFASPWQVVAPIAVAAILLTGSGILLSAGGLQRPAPPYAEQDEFEAVRAALQKFEFHDRLTLDKELDGAIHVGGFVETAVERRAVLAAIRETGIPVRVRVGVLELIRNEVADLLRLDGSGLDFSLTDRGVLTVTGVVLDPRRADRLRNSLRERTGLVSALEWQVETAETLFAEVGKLADRSRITPMVLLRLDGTLIEASGIIPTDKIDAWVGFLQGYSSQFAPFIPLRSFVQLQQDGSPSAVAAAPGGKALVIGDDAGRPGDVQIDVGRLRRGDYDLSDVLIGNAGAADGAQEEDALEAAAPLPDQPPRRLDIAGLLGAGLSGTSLSGTGLPGARLSGAGEEDSQSRAGDARKPAEERRRAGALPLTRMASVDKAPQPAAPAPETGAETRNTAGQRIVGGSGPWTPAPSVGPDLGGMGRRLLDLWGEGRLLDSGEGALLKRGMDLLGERWTSQTGPGQSVAARYDRMLADPRPFDRRKGPCWQGSGLTEANVAGTLFWLDLLSVSRDLSIADLAPDAQRLLLEAALNPEEAETCAGRALGQPVQSVYLHEVSRNASFVGHITRDYDPFSLDIVGASLASDRYVQTRSGRKMREGAAPDASSRLVVIGRLGVAVERTSGYAAHIFSDLDWLSR